MAKDSSRSSSAANWLKTIAALATAVAAFFAGRSTVTSTSTSDSTVRVVNMPRIDVHVSPTGERESVSLVLPLKETEGRHVLVLDDVRLKLERLGIKLRLDSSGMNSREVPWQQYMDSAVHSSPAALGKLLEMQLAADDEMFGVPAYWARMATLRREDHTLHAWRLFCDGWRFKLNPGDKRDPVKNKCTDHEGNLIDVTRRELIPPPTYFASPPR